MRQGFYAAIDIGTNAARFVIKNVYLNDKHQLNSYAVQELRVPLRLGVDVFRTGSIGMKKEEQLINTMACFKALMEIYDVIDYRALATSAVREAKNGEAIMWRIRKETGVDVKIISGETEAGTIVKIAKDLKLSGDWVFMDVGGGSTEITLCSDGRIIDSHSYPLGTLRILAGADKPETWKKLRSAISGYRQEYGKLNVVGTGGNINRYWKLSDHKDKKGHHILPVEDLKDLYDELSGMSVAERMLKFKLKPDRADVIIPAGNLFLTVSELLGSDYILTPMTGLGDGIIDNLIDDNMNVI